MVGVSWICSTLGKFRNRTFGSSLLNFLAIRISLRSIRPQIRRTHLSCFNPSRIQTNKKTCTWQAFLLVEMVGVEPTSIVDKN